MEEISYHRRVLVLAQCQFNETGSDTAPQLVTDEPCVSGCILANQRVLHHRAQFRNGASCYTNLRFGGSMQRFLAVAVLFLCSSTVLTIGYAAQIDQRMQS